MSDIVERLRGYCGLDPHLHREAADEIERLKAALREIKQATGEQPPGLRDDLRAQLKAHDIARTALKKD